MGHFTTRVNLLRRRPMARSARLFLVVAAAIALFIVQAIAAPHEGKARDPGVRGGAAGAGHALPDLTPAEFEYFLAGLEDFAEVEEVDEGMGPRMNLDSCGNCHLHPSVGGTSPEVNPQVAFAGKDGGTDRVPPFIRVDGPVREARFVLNDDGSPDGSVHSIFTTTGRAGAEGCSIGQPDFARELARRNVIFRIPTPVFGGGLIEQIPDAALAANQTRDAVAKRALGIRGRPNFHVSGRTISGQGNHNGNDGTIARFGWKAQVKSLLLFSGEAYNVEMGITNELIQTERDETPGCEAVPVPNSITDTEATTPLAALSAIEKFAFFMRFLAPPTPSADTPGGARSIGSGRAVFDRIGCAFCHTPSFTTGDSAVLALSHQPVDLFSDLLLHDMGAGLADGVSQGEASGTEFRSAPLWGLGQRLFFLHDGRTSNLIAAIRAHASRGSEANGVVGNYESLSEQQKQDLLNFLRSL